MNWIKWILISLAALIGITVVTVLSLRWVAPPTSAFMLQYKLKALWDKHAHRPIAYRWVDWPYISPYAPLAVVASEDQKFPAHWGFDTESIADAWEERREGRRLRGASTITQQVAKNLFLWPGRSFVRKGIEAYFTVLIEALWPKQRILEVYLNVAQFGDGIYGIAEAGRRFFGKPPYRLDREDCALLAAALPNPLRFRPASPSAYMLERRNWILSEMARLDRVAHGPYLENLID
jgi:monofunctional biosynthetic peptidoglycan transglycosylase